MRFASTRRAAGSERTYSFVEALQTGFCEEDGGILLPTAVPQLAPATLVGLSYSQVALAVVKLYCPDVPVQSGGIPHAVLDALLGDAHAAFGTADVVPIVPLEAGVSIAELGHGPTHAFKDLSMQPLARLLHYVLEQQGKRATVVVSTTGDTGPAALAAIAGKEALSCVVLFPLHGVSHVQRLQMLQLAAAGRSNVAVIATATSGDTNDDVMRALFADAEFVRANHVTTINSVNFGRILGAIAHYYYIYTRVEPQSERELVIRHGVPSGSFGNATAGWLAKQMGCPIALLVCNNANDVTHRMLRTGCYKSESLVLTAAPAIDCQVPYNFDRVFRFLADNIDPWLHELATTQQLVLPTEALLKLRATFASDAASDADIATTIADVWARSRYLIDPHTAVALHGARRFNAAGRHVVVLSTAHPYKFVEAVRGATGGVTPPLPFGLSFLRTTKEEDLARLPNVDTVTAASVDAVLKVVRQRVASLA